MPNRTNTWRLCNPHPNSCVPGFMRTRQCIAKTYDCRCYNWEYADYAVSNQSVVPDIFVDPQQPNCVVVTFPVQDANYTFQWQTGFVYDYTRPTNYQLYMLAAFYASKKTLAYWLPPFQQWWPLMLPTTCDAARANNIRQPALDLCSSSITVQTVVSRNPWADLPSNFPITATTSDSINTALLLWSTGTVTTVFLAWWWHQHHGHSARQQ